MALLAAVRPNGAGIQIRQYASVNVDVTVDPDAIDEGCNVKIQGDSVELNIHAEADELLALQGIRDASWNQRQSIRAGRSVGNPAWCVNQMVMLPPS